MPIRLGYVTCQPASRNPDAPRIPLPRQARYARRNVPDDTMHTRPMNKRPAFVPPLTIPIEQLAVGMFVLAIDLSWEDHPLLATSRGLVCTPADVSRLAQAGVRRVVIDPSRGAGPRPSTLSGSQASGPAAGLSGGSLADEPQAVQAGEAAAPLDHEIEVAAVIYAESLSFSRDLFASAKAGRLADIDQAKALVSRMIPSVLRNPFALSILTKLRGHDAYTYRHSVNLAALAVVFGHFLGLNRSQLEILGMAGLYHDIGKARVPERILNKPGKLTPEEFELMRGHCQAGYEIVSRAPGIRPEVAECVRDHHERKNGSGYPTGKRGFELSLYSRIVGLIDVYDALTSERCYRRGFPPYQAMRTLYAARDADFFTADVERFIKCLGIYPVTSLVRLSDGRVGVVCEGNRERPLKPKVKLVLSADLSPLEQMIIDLAAAEDDAAPGLDIVDCLDPREFSMNIEHLLQ
jgi:putative nucleotidyltransferase with HDIG domain